MSHTDIRRNSWVAGLPEGMQPYVLLGRFDRPIGAWLLFLPGLWSILLAGTSLPRSLWLIALFLIGSFVMRAAGCVVNDLWDREMDRQVTRTAGRPLASGAIGTRGALVFMVAMAVIGLMILLLLPPLAQGLGVASLVLVVTYPLAKRITWWPQLMLGFTFGWGAPMGFAAAAGYLSGAALWLYAAAILWIIGYDTIYAHQDREDDALVGIRSTARLFGEHSRWLVGLCYAGCMLALAVAGRFAGVSPWFLPALTLPAVLLAWQVVRLDVHDPARCLWLFKFNRETGLAIALAILLGRPVNDPLSFLHCNTVVAAPSLVPELRLWLATEITPIWQASEAWLRETDIEPPFWAFAWPGGQALARHVLDHPALVAGRRVLDFAAGGGIAAIACARAGATVEACEIDALAVAAIGANAALNEVDVTVVAADLVGAASRWDLILCGDVCYEAPMTAHILPWLREMARECEVWLADPGRAYLPKDGLEIMASYAVPTTLELEDRLRRDVVIHKIRQA